MKKTNRQLNIAMLGHKRIPSREGGIEIVVEELSTRMVSAGHRVTCLNRAGKHVSGKEFDVTAQKEYKGIQNLEKMQKQIEETPFETIPHLLFLGLKDKSAFTDSEGNKYPEVTEENILEDYGMGDIQKVTEVFTKALYGSLPQDNETEKKPEAEA